MLKSAFFSSNAEWIFYLASFALIMKCSCERSFFRLFTDAYLPIYSIYRTDRTTQSQVFMYEY